MWSELITEELSYKSVGAWLANEPQQLYYQFTAAKDGSQGESSVMRSFHWRPPDDPIPQGSQLLTRQEALEKWNALARDNKVVNAIRCSITQAPDALVKELMDVHGWPAHEALCAVQQLQQDVLDDTTAQVSA